MIIFISGLVKNEISKMNNEMSARENESGDMETL